MDDVAAGPNCGVASAINDYHNHYRIQLIQCMIQSGHTFPRSIESCSRGIYDDSALFMCNI